MAGALLSLSSLSPLIAAKPVNPAGKHQAMEEDPDKPLGSSGPFSPSALLGGLQRLSFQTPQTYKDGLQRLAITASQLEATLVRSSFKFLLCDLSLRP